MQPFRCAAAFVLKPWPRDNATPGRKNILAELDALKTQLDKERESDPLVIPLKLENIDEVSTEPDTQPDLKVATEALAKLARMKKAKNARERKRKRARQKEEKEMMAKKKKL